MITKMSLFMGKYNSLRNIIGGLQPSKTQPAEQQKIWTSIKTFIIVNPIPASERFGTIRFSSLDHQYEYKRNRTISKQ